MLIWKHKNIYLSTDASVEDPLPSPEAPFKDPDIVGGGLVADREGLPSLSVQSRLAISFSSEEPSLVRDPLFGKMDFFFFLQYGNKNTEKKVA